jgi:adenylate kinase
MLNIALFGPPGAGKGTQSKFLIEKYNLGYIATGDILRAEIAEGSNLGKQAKELIDKGELVPDEIIVQIIEKRIQSNKDANGILFDGFPRTVVQAYILEGLLLKLNTTLRCMISLEVPNKELINRLIERGKTSNRADDTPEIIQRRLEEYENKTAPVASFYKDQDKFYPLNGVGPIETIQHRIDETIEESLKHVWLNVVLTGRPGSGKGTQSKLLAKKYNLVHIATGDLLRKEIKEKTDIGKAVKPFVESGDLVPDEIVIKIIEKEINKNLTASGFLFDGFPLNIVQAYILDGLLRKLNSSVSCVYHLRVPSILAMKRLLARGKTAQQRSYDSDAEIIINRIEKFEKQYRVVNDYYKIQNKYSMIYGEGSVQEIFDRLSEKIEKALKRVR